MTVSLGGYALSDNLFLDGLEKAPGIAWKAKRTIGGKTIARTMPISGGRTLSLKSEYDIDHADVLAIKAIEAIGQPVALVHHRGTFTVLITGVELVPDVEIANPPPDADIWYSGVINLQEV